MYIIKLDFVYRNINLFCRSQIKLKSLQQNKKNNFREFLKSQGFFIRSFPAISIKQKWEASRY